MSKWRKIAEQNQAKMGTKIVTHKGVPVELINALGDKLESDGFHPLPSTGIGNYYQLQKQMPEGKATVSAWVKGEFGTVVVDGMAPEYAKDLALLTEAEAEAQPA